jgi:DNA primase
MIPKSFVQELLGRVDIVDVVESYVPLKRAGTNLVACCPFHNEKTPSFTVSPSKQFYHCFGCGAHGSAVGFLMEYSGMGYVEAIKDLASRVGMQVPEIAARVPETSGTPGAEQLTDVLQRAAQFYKSELKRSERAIAYLKSRGLTGDIAARYHLGYAPAGWQNLSAAFDNYQAGSLVEAGLVIQGDDGKRYDRFRDRVMFPIVSQRGQVIGFGGRVLDKSEPKYLNSPETPVFEKGRELYGLPQARRAIRDAGRILVVEGYMDVVALAQFEVGYVCAALGTATTPWHVQKLLRQSDEIVFCFDGDAAGRKAAWRALENSVAHLQDGKQIKFLFLPDQDDPDSFVRREGKEPFERLIAAAMPLSEFAVKHLTTGVDMGSAEGRAKFLQDAKPLVKQISAPIFGLMLRKRIAELSGVTQGELEQRFEIKVPRRGNESPTRVLRKGSDPYAKLLERVLAEPILLQELRMVTLPPPISPSVEANALFDLLEESTDLEQVPTFAGVIELLRGRGHEATLQKVMKDVQDLQRLSTEELRIEVRGSVQNLLAEAVEVRMARAAQGISSPGELTAEARALLRRAPELEKSVKTD